MIEISLVVAAVLVALGWIRSAGPALGVPAVAVTVLAVAF